MPLAHAGDSADNKKIMVYRGGEEISLCLPSEISNRDSQTTATAAQPVTQVQNTGQRLERK